MNACIIDSETVGKAKNFKAPMSDLDNWPRATQLAWQKINIETGEVINEYQSLIKPDGWIVPTEQFFIDNNMSTERCEAEGKPIAYVLNLLVEDLNDCDYVVAHNMAFDYNVVGAEMMRIKIKANKALVKICTMQSSTDYCAIPGRYGFKWPQMMELHVKLFGVHFDGAHDALDDVRACAKCFIELIRLGVIQI